MKYFEKNASASKAVKTLLKGVINKKEAYGRISKIEEKRKRLLSLEHKRPKFFDKNIEKIQTRLSSQSDTIRRAYTETNRMELERFKFGAAPVHPMQGTMLNVQTRGAQRKYNSKVLGKKRADILVPLWA